MDFLGLRRFRRGPKRRNASNPEQQQDGDVQSELPESKIQNGGNAVDKPTSDDRTDEEEGMENGEDEDDDDDFITNEVKRRLKELRKNSFMVLIPEEPSPEEEEEEEEASSSECRESMEDGQSWYRFDSFYEKYCERMLFFDKICCKQLQQAGSPTPLNPSPRPSSFKLYLRNLSFKRRNGEFQDECERLAQRQQQEEEDGGDPNENLERVYVAQICLTWEALHCQYMNLCQEISYQPQNSTCFTYAAQAFQQFQVLLQRFIENEPFDSGSRPEIYSRARCYLPMLLQVPNLHGFDEKEKEDGFEPSFLSVDLAKVLGECILTFDRFLKADKKRGNGHLHLFGDLSQSGATSLQQIQNSFEKKEMKLKELYKKKKSSKKKHWPTTHEEVSVLFGLIDFKVVSRVMRMAKISKEQLLWCEEKMCKLNPSDNGLQRDSTPTLFPC